MSNIFAPPPDGPIEEPTPMPAHMAQWIADPHCTTNTYARDCPNCGPNTYRVENGEAIGCLCDFEPQSLTIRCEEPSPSGLNHAPPEASPCGSQVQP